MLFCTVSYHGYVNIGTCEPNLQSVAKIIVYILSYCIVQVYHVHRKSGQKLTTLPAGYEFGEQLLHAIGEFTFTYFNFGLAMTTRHPMLGDRYRFSRNMLIINVHINCT